MLIRHLMLLCALAAPASAQAVSVQVTPTAQAELFTPPGTLVPQPQRAELPRGLLPLTELGLKVVGSAPELGWAARDLRAEWQVRLNAKLPDTNSGKPSIVIGTLADSDLSTRAKAVGLANTAAEGYALWVDASGAYVVGADARGAYSGAQTLRQLLTADGLRYARISDAPAFGQRIGMLYLDQYSKGVNDHLIPLLAALKYNAVLIMSNYVQWDTARAGGFAHPAGASKAEAKRVADLARSYGLEVIPLIETLGHVGWMYYGGKNLDLVQDPQGQNPQAYDTLNPATYDRVILPVLKEAVDLFQPKVLHIGHDEVRSRDRFPARENGLAVGFEKLFVDDTLKLHDYLKNLNVQTMIWHDTAFADSLIATLPAQLPKDVQVAYWNYTQLADPKPFQAIRAAGFPVLGASWSDPNNPESLSRAAQQAAASGMIQTRWSGYFGNPSVWDGQAQQGVALVRAANAFWNPSAPVLNNAEALYRDLYQPSPYRARPGATVNLAPLVTRSLKDDDEQGWILKGPDIDLRALPSGITRVGAYTFDIRGAVMLRGSRPAARNLPERAVIDLNRKADALAFLHTTAWSNPTDREVLGRYEIRYADGSLVTQPLEYGRHIRAWTDTLDNTRNLSMILAPAWQGKTRDGLDVNVNVLEWQNPKPKVAIRNVTLISEGKNANPTLIGLTLIGRQ